MHITEVRLENIRGFGAGDNGVLLEFERPGGSRPQWIVVAGRNGAGKSTFLQAVALAVAGPELAGTLRVPTSDWIHAGEASAVARLKVYQSESDGQRNADRLRHDHLSIGLRWQRSEDGIDLSPGPATTASARGSTGPWSKKPKGWFIAGYGPFRRLSPAPSDVHQLMTTPGRLSSLASLFREEASLSETVTWLQRLYLRSLEGFEEDDRLLGTVLEVLNDGLLPQGMTATHVTSDGLWVTTSSGIPLPLQSLSDGYRSVAALVLDILKQLHLSAGLVIDDENRARIRNDGVVLIDEIDVHMHVSWQQRIGFWLKEHFPNMQFIVTTHSPFICQAADENGLVRLPAPDETGGARIVAGELFNRITNGGADDAVMTELFGMETPYSAKAIRLREQTAELEFKASTEQLTPQERERLRELRLQLPQTLSADVAEALRSLTGRIDDAED